MLNLLFLPDAAGPPAHLPKPKSLFVSDAFTNPAHVHFALKVTFAAMFCYIFYMAIDWSGIHTALITCTFIALESTGATLHKGVLRIGGCVIGGALALFTLVFLMPHMDTIASLVVVVACASAIAGWVATGRELISYAGLQIAFAFFYSVFQGYAPDTDLDNVRNRVVGILFGLIVTGLVFQYIWPERTIDRLRAALRAALRQLARLLEIPRPEASIETAKSEAHALIAETSKSFEQARRYADLTCSSLKSHEWRANLIRQFGKHAFTYRECVRCGKFTRQRASLERMAAALAAARIAESELRNAAAKRIEDATTSGTEKDIDMRISQLRLPDGTKRWFGPRQTFALRAYPRLPLKFNTSTNIELMKPIPGTLQEGGASFQTTHWTLILSAPIRAGPLPQRRLLSTADPGQTS